MYRRATQLPTNMNSMKFLILAICFCFLSQMARAQDRIISKSDSLAGEFPIVVVADSEAQIYVGATAEVSFLCLSEPKIDSIMLFPGAIATLGFDMSKPYIWTDFGNLEYITGGCRTIPVFTKYEDGVSADFKNPFTVVGLRLKKDNSMPGPLKVKQIIFTGNNGETVSGAIEVDMGYDSPRVAFGHLGDERQTLTLNCAEGVELTSEPEIFYMAVPAIDYSKGYKFTVVTDRTDAKMAVITVSDAEDATLAANRLYGITEGILTESDFKCVIPDPIFRAWLQELKYVKEKDKLTGEVKITRKGRMARKILCNNMMGMICDPPPASWGVPNLSSLAGIGYFRQLRVLECERNFLGVLDLSHNRRLKRLNCSFNELRKLDLAENMPISRLNCSHNRLPKLDIVTLDKLAWLNCSSNNLESLDLQGNPLLSELKCSRNDLTSIDLTKNSNLVFVSCNDNRLSELNVSQNPILSRLECENNRLTTLDVSHNFELKLLSCNKNQLAKLDVFNDSKLEVLGCTGNQLTELDVSHNPELTLLSCGDNRLTVLDVSQNLLLMSLECINNYLVTIDTSKNLRLMYIDCSGNPFSTQPNVSEHERLMFYKFNDELKGKVGSRWLEWKKKGEGAE